MEEALTVEHLSVSYDQTPVLWDVHFSIPQGKLVGIIGPNGAGKSTLLKALLGITKPLSGKILFFSKKYKEMRKKIAYIPQRNSVDWDFPITVFDVVLMGRYGKRGYFRRVTKADREAVHKSLEILGLSAFAERQISELSGGQQQKVFLARALLQEADIYLMDEPFAGIDLATEKLIMNLFDQIRSQGKTLLVVHHDLHSVDQYFDWVILMNTSLIAVGPVEDVFTRQNLAKAYGGYFTFFDEAAKIARKKNLGVD